MRTFRYAPQGHSGPAIHLLLGSIEPGGVYEADDYAAAGLADNPDFTEVPAKGAEPVAGYDELNVDDVIELLEGLPIEEVEDIKAYEADHKDRKTIAEYAPERDGDGTEPGRDDADAGKE